MMATVLDVLAANRTATRRARNLRAGPRSREQAQAARERGLGPLGWLAAAGLLFGLAGAAIIVFHARLLGAETGTAGAGQFLQTLRPAMPGVSFAVPAEPGIVLETRASGALLIATAMQAQAPLRVDLCTQMLDPARPRLLPLRIGLPFGDVARLVERNAAATGVATLRNVVLAIPGSAMPRIQVTGTATPDFMRATGRPLDLRWDGGTAATRWIGDAGNGAIVAGERGQALLHQQGWLLMDSRTALHISRRPSGACPRAGELALQLYRAAGERHAASLVAAFPSIGAPVSVRLQPGRYTVPTAPAPGLEDGALFDQLNSHGLVRLGASGMAELAPSDLAAWRAASRQARVAAMAGWDGPALDKESRQLLARLYQKADGDYVREQVRIFNGERRLLAWRVRALPAGAQWRAAAAGAPVTLGATMPAGAGRLFQRLPQGWGPWQRVAQWPGAETAPLAALTLQLARPAATGETLDMIVAGSLAQVDGARLRMREDACTGHGCPAPDAVQRLVLDLLPGVHSVTLHAAPLDASPLTDAKYRHLAAVGGRLEWQDVPKGDVSALPAAAGVRLADRNGTELWGEGGATAQAAAAGLAPLLGLHPGHANSVAGMLARLPSLDGRPHAARLTLDLPLQAAAQAALECAGMRRGAWDGQTCTGGAAPPPARQAGLVLLDTDDGEILAAAGAGMPPVDESNWAEVLDFDRANPAASPLRLPALQHDGGGERSPGSTFKIISSLGLELAAQGDPQLDALLGGMRLSAMDSLAREKGFAFRTDSATYPADGRPAHITNFGETGLVRHAQDGRLGLVQALTYSLNSWFAWTSELSDRSLFGRPEGGVPDLQGLEPNALAAVRPIVAMAQRLGFERPLRLDGGLLPANYPWSPWDALRTTPAHIDPVHSRNELRMMAIGLRMQATPLQMALAAGAVGQGWVVQPRLLLDLDGRAAARVAGPTLGVRLDRIRAGMKGVVDRGTGSSAFRGARFDSLRPGLYGKTGTAPISEVDENGKGLASVWFAGWLEPGSLPGQTHRLAFAAFVSRSTGTGGADAAPVVAALLRSLAQRQASPPGQ